MTRTQERQSAGAAIKLLWSIMTPAQKWLCLPLFFALLLRSLVLLMPVQCMAAIIAKIQGEPVQILGLALPADWNVAVIAVVAFATIFLLWLVGTTVFYCLWLGSRKLTNQLNNQALAWTLAPRKNCDLGMTKGEFCYLIKSATDSVPTFIETLFIDTLPPLIAFALSIVYIGLIDWVVMLVVLGVSVILLLLAYGRTRLEKKLIENGEVQKGRINNLFLNSVTNLPFLSLFKCQPHEKVMLDRHNQNYYTTQKKRTRIQWNYWLLVTLLEYASMAVAVIITNTHTATISVAAAVLLLGYILNVYNPIERLGYNISNIQQAAIKINRIKLTQPDPTVLITPSPNRIAIDRIEKITIKNLSITQGAFQINNVNLVAQRGDLVALAGASGAGKTSVVQALLGLREHQSGQITVNDTVAVDSLFFDDDKIAYAMQDMQLFDRSLPENIFYPDLATADTAEPILKALALDKLLTRNRDLTEGVEQKLSGGEKKRVNLARAMLKPAQLYIFDEPTNELDAKNVQTVINLIKDLSSHAIVMVITHDSRLIEQCNKVFYF